MAKKATALDLVERYLSTEDDERPVPEENPEATSAPAAEVPEVPAEDEEAKPEAANPNVETLVSLWTGGNHTAVALRVLDSLDNYRDFVDLLYRIGNEDALELGRIMDDFTKDEKSPHNLDDLPDDEIEGHNGKIARTHAGAEEPGGAPAPAAEEEPERFESILKESPEGKGGDDDDQDDVEAPEEKKNRRNSKMLANLWKGKKKAVKESMSTEELQAAWEDDENGEYVQIADSRGPGYRANFIAHGSVSEEIAPDGTDWDDVIGAIEQWKEQSQYFPNVWYVNERGNIALLDKEGNSLGGLV